MPAPAATAIAPISSDIVIPLCLDLATSARIVFTLFEFIVIESPLWILWIVVIVLHRATVHTQPLLTDPCRYGGLYRLELLRPLMIGGIREIADGLLQ